MAAHSRSRRLAATLASLQQPASRAGAGRRLPFKFFDRLAPTQVAGLPRYDHDDNESSAGYTRHFERAESEENLSTQIDNEYSRHLIGRDDPADDEYAPQLISNDDDDSITSINSFQLRPGRFGGISTRYRNEFGRGPSTLLTGDASRAERVTTNSDAGDVQTRDERGFSGGELGNHDNDDASSVADLQLRPSRFGGVSQMSRHRNVFGRGPSTLLSGRHGSLSSNIAADEVETTVLGGRAVDDGDAVASQRDGRSVLTALTNWRRRRDSQRQAPGDDHVEMQQPEWLRGVEPDQRQHESSVDNNNNDSASDNVVNDVHNSQLPPHHSNNESES